MFDSEFIREVKMEEAARIAAEKAKTNAIISAIAKQSGEKDWVKDRIYYNSEYTFCLNGKNFVFHQVQCNYPSCQGGEHQVTERERSIICDAINNGEMMLNGIRLMTDAHCRVATSFS